MAAKKILVVDDEASIRELFERVLEDGGYDVLTAETAEEALEILKSDNAQVMFIDLNLPGMNGVELAKEIRKVKPIAIMYAFTGYPSVFELMNCREVGFDDYFKKPIKIETIIEAVTEAFKKVERWTRK